MLDSLLSTHRCRVEALTTSQDAAGGTAETYTTVADQLACLVSLSGAGRDGRFDGQSDTVTGTVSSEDPLLTGLSAGRVFFYDGPAGGRYGYAVGGAESHAAHPFGLVPAVYRARWSTVKSAGV